MSFLTKFTISIVKIKLPNFSLLQENYRFKNLLGMKICIYHENNILVFQDYWFINLSQNLIKF